MPDAAQFTTDYYVKVDGADLAADQLGLIRSISVEQNLYLPDTCTIIFHDVGMGQQPNDPLQLGLTNRNILPLGTEVEIGLGRDQQAQKVFKGEVIAHDVDIGKDEGPQLVVRAYNRAHRLQRGRFTRSFLKMTFGDVATKIAQDAGFQAQVDSTPEVYPYLLQNNQTNWEFLRELAIRAGYEVTVDGTALRFGKPHPDRGSAMDLALGTDLLHAHLRLSSVGQVSDVVVSSWDATKKSAITGRATTGMATVQVGQQTGATLINRFGQAAQAHMTLTHPPAQSQSEADMLAQAALDDLSGNAVHLEAEVLGKPNLQPGQVVSLKELGARFSGRYYVTSARHHFGGKHPYTTAFTVGGRRSGSLLEMMSGPGLHNGHGIGSAMTIGIVTNNKDEQNLGRVKVKLPWFWGDQGTAIETDWARIVAPSAGNGRGFYWLPEVNDEVLVAFEQADPRRAYVIGALWNGQDKPPQQNSAVVTNGAVTQRIIQSRSGHIVLLDDTDSKGKVSITSSSGHTITLDDASGGQKITIADNTKNNLITIDTQSNKITLSAQGDLELKATGNVKVSGMAISVEAQSNCDIKANANASFQASANLDLKATGNAKVSGAMASVEAQGICSVKGSMVQLN